MRVWLILLLVSPAALAGELYGYIDADGQMVFSDRPLDARAQRYRPGVGFVAPVSKPAAAGKRPLGDSAAGRARHRPIFERAARAHAVPLDLLLAVGAAESGFNAKAKSSAGACGVMQLMPATARELGVDDVWDPGQNIDGGARYLAGLIKRFGRTDLALAAYNAGPGRVERAGGIPEIAETQQYVRRVISLRRAYAP